MAELNEKAAASNRGRVRSRKRILRVDLTAMVDLAFLLITFFILTTTLQKPNAMPLVMPDKEGEVNGPVPSSRTMTVLIGAKDKLQWYIGETDKPLIPPTIENFGPQGIRRILTQQSARIKKEQGKEMIVLIKPSDKSNYENVVNIMDELNITKNAIRAIVDITPAEVDLLKRDNIYD